MINNEEPHERLIRLEEKHDNMYQLTQQIADNADQTAKALQELVLIHKETSTKAEADREDLRKTQQAINDLWNAIGDIKKVVWRYIFVGTGMGTVLGLIWYVGLLPALIEANGVIVT